MKKGNALRLSIAALLFVCLISPAFAGANQIIVDLPEYAITVKADENGQAIFNGATLSGEPGNPYLPMETITILLPPNADPATVKITLYQPIYQDVPGIFDVKPAPPVMVTSSSQQFWPRESIIANGRNQLVYQNDQLFPKNNLGKVSAGQKRKWVLAETTVYPYQYNPVKRTLRRLTGGKLIINYENLLAVKINSSKEDPISEELKEELSKKAINFDDIAPQYESIKTNQLSSTKPTYVIITTEVIRSSSKQLDNFINAKQSQGFEVEVITETVWGGGQGNVAAERIRSWLSANYLSRNIKYVLLIGDPHPLSGEVPMKVCYPLPSGNVYEESPTDLYYAELTGNWDLNNNGRYGEFDGDYGPGGADRNFEVIVGRIPYYGSIADLDNILSKTIAYGNFEEDWRKKILLPMKPSDASTPGYHLGEAIKNFAATYDCHRIYDEDYSLNPAPETIPCTVQNVTNVWSNTPFGAVFWWTHGWSQGASDIMDISAAPLLNNTRPAFTFQCSCSNSYPEDASNLSYELLKNGAIGTVGGTRVTWYYPGQTEFENTATNSGMTYQYAKNLVGSQLPAGNALQKLKSDIAPGIEHFWMNYLSFVLYGDPSVGLNTYTKKPVDLIVADFTWEPAQVTTDSQVRFSATIKNQGTLVIPEGTPVSVAFDIEYNGAELTTVQSDCLYLAQPLSPGATFTLSANNTWQPLLTGEFSVNASVTCYSSIDEWIYNNSLSKKLVVDNSSLFYDNFEDGNANGWFTQYGAWSIVFDNGSYVYYQADTAEGRTWTGSSSWKDYSVEAKVKVENFNGSNCAFVCARYKDGNNYYAASLYNNSGGKLQIRRKSKGSTKILVSKPYPLTSGVWYTVKLEVKGEQINMYVNGELELTATDDTLTSGGIGLIAYKVQAKFDDVIVAE